MSSDVYVSAAWLWGGEGLKVQENFCLNVAIWCRHSSIEGGMTRWDNVPQVACYLFIFLGFVLEVGGAVSKSPGRRETWHHFCDCYGKVPSLVPSSLFSKIILFTCFLITKLLCVVLYLFFPIYWAPLLSAFFLTLFKYLFCYIVF